MYIADIFLEASLFTYVWTSSTSYTHTFINNKQKQGTKGCGVGEGRGVLLFLGPFFSPQLKFSLMKNTRKDKKWSRLSGPWSTTQFIMLTAICSPRQRKREREEERTQAQATAEGCRHTTTSGREWKLDWFS